MQSTEFPNEIVEEIAQHVDSIADKNDRVNTLKSGSLTCRSYKLLFQRFIFREVYLHDKKKSALHRFMSNVATPSPVLLKYIRSFSIKLEELRDQEFYDLYLRVMKNKQIERCLIYAFDIRLSYLNNSLHPDIPLSNSNDSLDISDYAITRLSSSLCNNQALRELCFYNHFYPFSGLHQCQNLKKLSLFNALYDHEEDIVWFRKPEDPAVELDTLQVEDNRYRIDRTVRWLLHPQCPFDVHKLKTLILPGVYHSQDGWEVMKMTAQVVETIHLGIGAQRNVGALAPIIDFSIFPKLSTLRLKLYWMDEDMNSLTYALRDGIKGNPERNISLDIILFHSEMAISSENWERWISDIFGLLVTLRDTHIVIVFQKFDGWDKDIIKEYLDRKYPDLKHIEITFNPGKANIIFKFGYDS